jgi:hypothetical protein
VIGGGGSGGVWWCDGAVGALPQLWVADVRWVGVEGAKSEERRRKKKGMVKVERAGGRQIKGLRSRLGPAF